MVNFYIGVNYWPEISNIKFWSRWDLKEIENDFAKMREIGLNSIRAFLLNEDCANFDGSLKVDCKEKIRIFLDLANRYGIKVFLTFIVGHMSGKNWPIPWDPNNEVYTSRAIEGARKLILDVVKEFKDHPAIGGWILTNEITLVRKPNSIEEFRVWANELYTSIKGIDSRHLVSIGDSVSLYSPTYLKPENLKGIIDYASPHLYLYDEDPIRHTMTYESVLEYCRSSGITTLLEEFGYPTSLYSEESQAGFIDVILHSALFYGTIGAFIWCFSDFSREGDEPYLWEPHELTFGIFRSDLSKKPSADVVSKFAKKIRGLEEYKVPKRDVAIMVPAFLYRDYPFMGDINRRWETAKILSQAFSIARLVGINVTFVREDDEFLNQYKLIIVPSITRLLSTTWRKLLNFVENGGTLYYSSLIIDYHMSATHIWEELFGIKPNLDAGSGGIYIPEDIELEFIERFGSLRIGDRIRLESKYTTSFLKTYRFKEIDAKVIASVPHHNLHIFLNKKGKGHVILSSIPFEAIVLLSTIGNYGKGIEKFYRSLAEVSGVYIPYYAEPLGVEAVYLEGENDDIVGLLNHTFEDKDVLFYYPQQSSISEVLDDVIIENKGNPAKLKIKSKSAVMIKVKK